MKPVTIDPDVYEIARRYVADQLAIMEKHLSQPELTPSQLDRVIRTCAEPLQRLRPRLKTPRKVKTPEPRVSVYCRCGAQWHGKSAVNNPVTAEHSRRCGALLAADEYESLGHVVKQPAGWNKT